MCLRSVFYDFKWQEPDKNIGGNPASSWGSLLHHFLVSQGRPEALVPPLLPQAQLLCDFTHRDRESRAAVAWVSGNAGHSPEVPLASRKPSASFPFVLIWRFLLRQELGIRVADFPFLFRVSDVSLPPVNTKLPLRHSSKAWVRQCVEILGGAKNTSPEMWKERSSCKGRLSLALLPWINKSVNLYWAPLPAHAH